MRLDAELLVDIGYCAGSYKAVQLFNGRANILEVH